MINEVLTEILAAEKKAAEIKADGEAKASELLAVCEKNCAEITKRGAEDVKSARAEVMRAYEQKAEDEYNRIVSDSERAGKVLADDKKSSAQRVADEIYGRIINGDC